MSKRKYESTIYDNPEILYTEDGFLVKTVLVCGPEKPINKRVFEEYFEDTYGPINYVTYHCERRKTSPNFALVTFRCAEDAMASISSRRFFVQPAESWHQPNYNITSRREIWSKSVSIKTKSNKLHDNGTEDSLFLRLNDDCLLHIFKFLNRTDIIYLSRTCNRLRTLADRRLSKIWNIVNLSGKNRRPLSLMNLRTLCIGIGHYIQSLTINGHALRFPHERYLDLVFRKCTKLKELNLIGITFLKPSNGTNSNSSIGNRRMYASDISRNKYYTEYPTMDNLKVLQLNQVDIDENYLKAKLGQFCRLTELKLISCPTIVGDFFCVLRKLKYIYIDKCSALKNSFLKNLYETNSNTLTHLTFVNTSPGDDHFEMDDQKQLVKLEYLRAAAFHCVTNFKKQLSQIKSFCFVNDSFLRAHIYTNSMVLNELSVNNKCIEKLVFTGTQTGDFSNFTDAFKTNLLQLSTLQILKFGNFPIESTCLIDCAKKMKCLRVFNCNKVVNVSNNDVISIVQNATKLTELTVGNLENSVSVGILPELINILKSEENRPKLCYKLIIYKYSLINNAEVIAVKNNYLEMRVNYSKFFKFNY